MCMSTVVPLRRVFLGGMWQRFPGAWALSTDCAPSKLLDAACVQSAAREGIGAPAS